ncbi:hypothetical protein RA307_26580 [Xanthobacteraceae bacterium Astr-EGSB]|uniref:hypothetical protein n=1 Tax=Astrobacterium formosum TaxID=3069710 RepID=UPI0027B3B78A|nr:hypothetical protein [Xanthobacteraceae bacterium Astr-EGSB]
MNEIVREHYPVSKLPEELRPGGDPDEHVTVIIKREPAGGAKPPVQVMTLEEIFAARRPPFLTKEEIDADLRRQRDEWDD